MKKQPLLVSLLALGTALSISSCGSTCTYKGLDMTDDEIYEKVLPGYNDLLNAKTIEDDSKRFVEYAAAEAILLDSGAFMPMSTKGGTPELSRVAYKSQPSVYWGLDYDRVDEAIVTKATNVKGTNNPGFITEEVKGKLKDKRDAAMKITTGVKDQEAAYSTKVITDLLKQEGYEINNEYVGSVTTFPKTWDALQTSQAADTDMICQGLVGLFQYDRLGNTQARMCEPYAKSEINAGEKESYGGIDALSGNYLYKKSKFTWKDSEKKEHTGEKYTFRIKQEQYWIGTDGNTTKEVKASDFANGFRHMLDSDSGLDWLVDGVIHGVTAYLKNKTDENWENVGVIADDTNNTLTFKLPYVTPYFPTMLTYSIFLPMDSTNFSNLGGKYGKEWDSTCSYGTDFNKVSYNGHFYPTEATDKNKIVFKLNSHYGYLDGENPLNQIVYLYDDGSATKDTYEKAKKGETVGVKMTANYAPYAVADGYYPNEASTENLGLAKLSDTESVTYIGALNVHRQKFGLFDGDATSPKNNAQAEKCANAMMVKNFRKAILHSIDKNKYLEISNGKGFGLSNSRNMYCKPDFVKLDKRISIEDGTFPSGKKYNAKTFEAGTDYHKVVEYFIEQMCGGKDGKPEFVNSKGECNLEDGQDVWYNKELAQYYFKKAMEEQPELFTETIQIDMPYYDSNAIQKGQAYMLKYLIEDSLTIDGKKMVQLNLLSAKSTDNYYNCAYRVKQGADCNFDIYLGNGWGPDFGDPISYLDTYAQGNGYMTKLLGLY